MTGEARSAAKGGEYRFAVVIPTYNHGGRVATVAREALALGWPVFVVDDGSTDDTSEKLRTVAGLHVIRHAVNRGKGAALISGMRRA